MPVKSLKSPKVSAAYKKLLEAQYILINGGKR